MKKWAHKLEVFVDHLIPYCLVLLLFVIVGEVFFHETVAPYHHYIELADAFIITVFVTDLFFKYLRARNYKDFFKKNWLDFIAVVPAIILIRFIEAAMAISRIELVTTSAHGALEAGAKWNYIVREVEAAGKISRIAIAEQYLVAFARFPRFIKALTFFERPTGHPRQHGHGLDLSTKKKTSKSRTTVSKKKKSKK